MCLGGVPQGGFFDTSPGDGTGPLLTPLVNNSAMAAAMQLYAALRAYGPPDELTAPCLPYNQHFVMGNCALTLSWGFQVGNRRAEPNGKPGCTRADLDGDVDSRSIPLRCRTAVAMSHGLASFGPPVCVLHLTPFQVPNGLGAV